MYVSLVSNKKNLQMSNIVYGRGGQRKGLALVSIWKEFVVIFANSMAAVAF